MSDVIDLLLQHGLLDEEAAARVRDAIPLHDDSPATAAVRAGGIDPAVIESLVVANHHGYDWSGDMADEPTDTEAPTVLSRDQASSWGVVPLRFEDGVLVVAGTPKSVRNPRVKTDMQLQGVPFRWVVTTERQLEAKRNVVYRNESEIRDLTARVSESTAEATDAVVPIVNLILDQAIVDGASDIHVEPGERRVYVRYRIDGVLVDKDPLPVDMRDGVISRLKILSGIDIAERRKPQDGRLSFVHNGRKIDMRVACLPAVWGEKVVLRILDNTASRMSLAGMAFSPAVAARWADGYRKPYGMILVTGPTGSGKSTTLYATLNEIATVDKNVITVEDPVEYRMRRINQVQVNPKAGLTFASALRSILRADPDIVLLGEIRDKETATIAVEAALTGHLVLSTLHTNSAPEAAVRLIEMGVEPFLVSSVLEVVLAQRLVRRLCEFCRRPIVPDQALLDSVGFQAPPGVVPTFYEAVGCSHCSGGFRGRMAIHEAMSRSPQVEKALMARVSSQEIVDIAVGDGMATMRQDGWAKVAAGLTTIPEILRVVA